MGRIIDVEKDKKVLAFLKTHTWIETRNEFQISSRTVKNIKDRNSVNSTIDKKIDYQEASKELLSLFLELSKESTITTSKWNKAIKNNLTYDLMDKLKEVLNL